MARKPRKSSKPSRNTHKYKQVSKVRHAGNFLYTFDCVRTDGTHQTVQVVFRDDDAGALQLAKQILEGYGGYGRYRGYSSLGLGYWAYGYAGYAYWGYAY